MLLCEPFFHIRKTVPGDAFLLQFQNHRAVIGSQDIGKVVTVFDEIAGVWGAEEIVDSPANIPLTGAGTHTPPGVMVGLLIKKAETVEVAMGEHFIQPVAFDG